MMNWTRYCLLVLVVTTSCATQPNQTLNQESATSASDVRKLDMKIIKGESVVVNLGYGIKVNAESSLTRTSYVINDPAAPAKLSDAQVRAVYQSGDYSGYWYQERGNLDFNKTATAFEVIHLLFDVWGERTAALSSDEIIDIDPGSHPLHGEWRASGTDIRSYLTGISYVRRVRLSDGTIWTMNEEELYLTVLDILPNLKREALFPDPPTTLPTP